MKLDTLKSSIADKSGSTLEFPFGPETLVYKVGGKIFAIVGSDDDPLTVSLKCDPMEAEALRADYKAITPGYHLNKRHWNTVALDGTVPKKVVEDMIDGSYDLVFRSLTKAQRNELEGKKE